MKLCNGRRDARRARAALLACGLLAAGAADAAEEKPLWELGAGVGVLSFPAYRGSDERRLFVLPVPYVVYRGDILKADRRGVRAQLFDSDRVELNLSLAASPPVSSDDVDVRAGMPDLKPTVEIGPSLNVKLWQTAAADSRLYLRLPVRAGVTVEGSPRSTGWLFTPQLNLDIDAPLGFHGWTLGLLAGPLYGDRRQHEYFYGVDPRYATATRPAYEAKGGYAGMQALAAVWKRYPSWWVGGFVRYDTLGGAVFADSPLVTGRRYLAGGIAVSWIFGESRERVTVDEE